MTAAIKGDGFDSSTGGFTHVLIGDKRYPKQLIISAVELYEDTLRKDPARAAAHDLLAALKACVRDFGGLTLDIPTAEAARAAIAKAESR